MITNPFKWNFDRNRVGKGLGCGLKFKLESDPHFYNRTLPGTGKLWDQVMAQALLGRICFLLPAGRGHKSRTVEQDIRVERVQLSDKAKGTMR